MADETKTTLMLSARSSEVILLVAFPKLEASEASRSCNLTSIKWSTAPTRTVSVSTGISFFPVSNTKVFHKNTKISGSNQISSVNRGLISRMFLVMAAGMKLVRRYCSTCILLFLTCNDYASL